MSVEITQADRDAAAAITVSPELAEVLRGAGMDEHTYVQAFAKHRSTSTEEVERLREALEKIQSNDQIPRHKVYRVPPSEETVDGPYARIARTALTGASNHVE